jgi:thiocyanate desulfurase
MFEKQAATKVAEQEEPSLSVKVDLRTEASNLPDELCSVEENYLKRKEEVTRQDYEEFLRYRQEKARQDQARQVPRSVEVTDRTPLSVNRRNFLTVVAGTAAVGEAGVLAYTIKNDAPAHGLKHAGEYYTEVQRHNIDRQLINPKADIGGRGFGDWVLLTPTKLGGGTYAVNLNTGRCLAWIAYWNYGDYNPISHHLCAFPSADPELPDLRHSQQSREACRRV